VTPNEKNVFAVEGYWFLAGGAVYLFVRGFDNIHEAASYAIDHPKEAVEPETYVRTVKGNPAYRLTLLPATMPAHRGAYTTVPDFRNQTDESLVYRMASDAKLTLAFVEDASLGTNWRVGSQSVAPGQQVALGTSITLTEPFKVLQIPFHHPIGLGKF
jgi:hypothetical protein